MYNKKINLNKEPFSHSVKSSLQKYNAWRASVCAYTQTYSFIQSGILLITYIYYMKGFLKIIGPFLEF